MAQTNTTVLGADLQPYFSAKLLELTTYKTVFKNFAVMTPIPAGSGKSVTFTQYANLTPPSGTLTEGVTPTDDVLSISTLTATVDQVGQFVTLTDLGELTVKHPVMQNLMENLSQSAARAYDNRIQTVLAAGTAVQYANNRASRATVAAGDNVTTVEFSKAAARLRQLGGMPLDNGNFGMVVDPYVEQDIVNDNKFNTAAAYSQVQKLNENTIGTWYGITVQRSNNIPVLTGAGAAGINVHVSYVFAKNAFAVTDLQTLQMYVEREGGTSDPLHQRRTAGYKFANKAIILNQNWMTRIESASAFN